MGASFFFDNLQDLSHYIVSANIKCIILYISEQTNAKLTKQMHINNNFLTINFSDEVMYLIVEKNPCPNSRN